MSAPRRKRRPIGEIRAELREVHAGISAAHWAFTRQARAKPACVAVPHLYQRVRELEAERRKRGAKVGFYGRT